MAEHGLYDSPLWCLVVLLLAFVVVGVLIDWLSEYIEQLLKHRRGLLHTFRKLKSQLLALGLISLLLEVLQGDLVKICVHKSKHGSGGTGLPEPAGQGLPVDDEDDPAKPNTVRNLLMTVQAQGLQRLLLSASDTSSCKEGTEPLWSESTLHDAHKLVYLIAATQTIYLFVSLGACLLKLHTWRQWETQAKLDGSLSQMHGALVAAGSSPGPQIGWGHWLYLQLLENIDHEVYGKIRQVYILQQGFEANLDYLDLVTRVLEQRFAQNLRYEFLVWVFALLFFALGKVSVLGYVVTALVAVMTAAIAGKLWSITIFLAHDYHPVLVAEHRGGLPAAWRRDVDSMLEEVELHNQRSIPMHDGEPMPLLAVDPHPVPRQAGWQKKLRSVLLYNPVTLALIQCCERGRSTVRRHHDKVLTKHADLRSLFWFHSSDAVLVASQLVYFQNSVYICMLTLAFSNTAAHRSLFPDISNKLLVILLLIEVAVGLINAWLVLPLFALLQPLLTDPPEYLRQEAERQQSKLLRARTLRETMERGRKGADGDGPPELWSSAAMNGAAEHGAMDGSSSSGDDEIVLHDRQHHHQLASSWRFSK